MSQCTNHKITYTSKDISQPTHYISWALDIIVLSHSFVSSSIMVKVNTMCSSKKCTMENYSESNDTTSHISYFLHVWSFVYTVQPFHHDSCDILTKNKVWKLHKFYINYSGLVKLWYFVKEVASYVRAKKRRWWVTRYQNKRCWISWLTWCTTEKSFQIQSHSCHFVSNFPIKH